MKTKTQDTKFWIENNRLVSQSGSVPEDEPLFILRARDVFAASALRFYGQAAKNGGANQEHLEANFLAFGLNYPDRMKVPDTNLKELHDGKPE